MTGRGACTSALGVLLTVAGCASAPPRSDARAAPEAPDLAWVCAQHDLVTDFRGRITFEDVQRTLCYLGRNGDVRDPAALARAALAEAGQCGGGPRIATASAPPTTVWALYDTLKRAAAEPSASPGCIPSLMIAGMVRALGDGYQFEPLGPPPPSPVNVETPSLMNKTVVYALVPRLSAATQALVADALRAARA